MSEIVAIVGGKPRQCVCVFGSEMAEAFPVFEGFRASKQAVAASLEIVEPLLLEIPVVDGVEKREVGAP